MPIKLKKQQKAPETSTWRKFGAGGARVVSSLLGGAIGAVPTPVTTGAAAGIGGLGEMFAQQIEQGGDDTPLDLDWKRIGAEAAISAVPFGKFIHGGKALKSAVQTGLATGAGEAGRQYVTEGKVGLGSTALATALGAATGGAFGGFTSPRTKAPSSVLPDDVVETTARTGPDTRVLNEKDKLVPNKGPAPIPRRGERPRVSKETAYRAEPSTSVPYGGMEPAPYRSAAKAAQRAEDTAAEKLLKQAEEARLNDERLAEIDRRKKGLEQQDPTITETIKATDDLGTQSSTIKWGPPDEGPVGKLKELLTTGVVRNGGKAWEGLKKDDIPPEGVVRDIFVDWLERGRSPRRALRAATKGRPHVESGIQVPGAYPVERFDDGVSRVTLGVKPEAAPAVEAAAQKWSPDEVEALAKRYESIGDSETASKIREAGRTGEVPSEARVPDTPTRAPEPLTAPPVEESTTGALEQLLEPTEAPSGSVLAKFFKSPLEAAGENYGAIKAAKAAGEVVPEEGRRIAGQAAQRLRKESGLPTPPRGTSQKLRPAGVEGDPNAALQGVAETTDKLKDLGVHGRDLAESVGLIDRLKQLNKGQTGEISQELMVRLGLGVGAGLAGAAIDPLDNPLASGAAGFAVGAGAPSIVKGLTSIGVKPEVVNQLSDKLSTPDGIREAASSIARSLPQLQRFNYLADVVGLPANALVGPWGAAMMGAIEHGLSGDPRGWVAAKSLLNGKKFMQNFWENRDEARRILHEGELGRAEMGVVEHLPKNAQEVLQAPGTVMTAGDVTARKFLHDAGFTEDEARRITLTSMPELQFFRDTAEAYKNSPFGQFVFPFRRTPSNIAEQGAMRTPLGFFLQGKREVPDALKQQLVQQGLGAGVGLGAYGVGSNVDPETAKIIRRYVTNLGGQYSLHAGLGFGLGQASNRGTPMNAFEKARAVDQVMPLPTAEPIIDWLDYATSGFASEKLPKGARPQIGVQAGQVLGLLDEPAPPIPRIRIRSSRSL